MQTSTNENGFSKRSEEFNGKTADLSKDIKDLGKITGAIATDAVSMVQSNAHQYLEQGKSMYDQGLKTAQKYEKQFESRIQKNPLQALLIVGGVGLVLGALWNRR